MEWQSGQQGEKNPGLPWRFRGKEPASAGDMGSIPVWEDPTLHRATKPMCQEKQTALMAPGPITSWEIDGETVETVSDFIFLGSKLTVDGLAAMKLKGAYSLEEKF